MDRNFPDNRLDGETPLRQAQLVMLRMLKTFSAICEARELRYLLDAGTLLGAVRHGGFIPWDDDVDVLMPREDYDRFLAIAQSDLPYDMFLQSSDSDPGFACPWVKIRDRYSHLEEETGPYPYSQAIFIDIFPAVRETRRQHRLRGYYSLLPPLSKKPELPSKSLPLKSNLKRSIVAASQYLFLGLMRIKPLRRAFESFTAKGEKLWAYEPPIRYAEAFEDELVLPLAKIRFEDGIFWGPADPQRYLTRYFGDYMKLPPPEARRSEHRLSGIFPIGPNPHWSGLDWKADQVKRGRA